MTTRLTKTTPVSLRPLPLPAACKTVLTLQDDEDLAGWKEVIGKTMDAIEKVEEKPRARRSRLRRSARNG